MKEKLRGFVAFVEYIWLVCAVLWTLECGSQWLLERRYHFAAMVYVIVSFGVVITALVETIG